jgi:hypothetical protein
MCGVRPIYPELAAAHGAAAVPFRAGGVAGEAALNQADGIHPNAAGVDAIVQGLTPKAEELRHPREVRAALTVTSRVDRMAKSRHDSASLIRGRPAPRGVNNARLFTGLEIPARCSSRSRCCAADCRARAGSIRKIITSRLRFIGDIDDRMAHEIASMLDGVRRRSFDVRFGGLTRSAAGSRAHRGGGRNRSSR